MWQSGHYSPGNLAIHVFAFFLYQSDSLKPSLFYVNIVIVPDNDSVMIISYQYWFGSFENS